MIDLWDNTKNPAIKFFSHVQVFIFLEGHSPKSCEFKPGHMTSWICKLTKTQLVEYVTSPDACYASQKHLNIIAFNHKQ